MSTPTAPAPATPAATPATPAAPRSLSEVRGDLRNIRSRPAPAPSSGSFVKLGGKPVPTPAAKAGAPAPAQPRAPDGKFVAPAAPASAPTTPAGDATTPVGDAKRAVTEQAMGEPRKYKVKIDGQEREVLDTELVQSYQIRSHLDKQMRQIAEYTNLAKKDFNALVVKLAEEYGQDPQKIAESILLKRAEAWQREQELAKLTPEQREYAELKREKEERLAAEAKQNEEKAAQEAKAAKEASARATYEKTTNILIEAHKLLPDAIKKHPEFNGRSFQRVKDRLVALASQVPGNTPIDAFLASVDVKELARGALADHRAELRMALETAADGELDELVPDTIREKLIARARAALQARHPQLSARPQVGSGPRKPAEQAAPKPLSEMKPSMASMINRSRKG